MDRRLDMIVGVDCNQAQICEVRSLTGKWKIIVFCDLECPMTKPVLFDIIKPLETSTAKVISTACDEGSRNLGLYKSLGVTKTKVYMEKCLLLKTGLGVIKTNSQKREQIF